jgi:hypothetical protein
MKLRSYDDRAHELCVINQLYVYIWKLYRILVQIWQTFPFDSPSLSLFLSTTITAQITCLLGIFPYWKFILKSIFVSSCGKMWMAEKTNIICLNSWGHELGECWQRGRARGCTERWRNKNLQEPVCVLHLMCKHYFLYRMKMFPTNLALSPNEYISQWMSEEIKPKNFMNLNILLRLAMSYFLSKHSSHWFYFKNR